MLRDEKCFVIIFDGVPDGGILPSSSLLFLLRLLGVVGAPTLSLSLLASFLSKSKHALLNILNTIGSQITVRNRLTIIGRTPHSNFRSHSRCLIRIFRAFAFIRCRKYSSFFKASRFASPARSSATS